MVQVHKVPRPRQLSEVVKVELHPEWSRDSGTVLAGEAVDLGQVLACITAAGATKGKLVVLDPAGVDGSEVAIGVSQAIVEAGASDVPVVFSARGTVVALSGLRWPAGITDADKAEALGQLAALGIVAR